MNKPILGSAMGLLLGHARYVARICVEHAIKGRVLTMGKQDVFISLDQFAELVVGVGIATVSGNVLVFRDPQIMDRVQSLFSSGRHMNPRTQEVSVVDYPIISDELFYTALGFESVDAVDISSHEGANILFDLNQPDIKSVIKDRYDLVIDSGVMEHVFDVRQVFLHITDLIKVGGNVIHVMPGNNFYDHGFYQLSPTLYWDYYHENKYDVLNAEVLEYRLNTYAKPDTAFVPRYDSFRNWTYDPSLMSRYSFGQLTSCLYYSLLCARKRPDSLRDRTPTQGVFNNFQRK